MLLQSTEAGKRTLLAVALVSISLVVFPTILQAAVFIAGGFLSRVFFSAGVIIALVLPVLLLPRDRILGIAYAVVVSAVLLCAAVQGAVWDNTNDSLTYHVPAAIELAEGANPVHGELDNFWANHHPKAAWVFSAGVYSLSGNLEHGKVINVLMLLASFAVAGVVLLSIPGLPRTFAYLIAALVAFNPVTLMQLNTHYVDGLFSSAAAILILLVVAYDAPEIDLEVPIRPLLVIAGASAVLAANLKFTGLVFVCALFVLHLGWRLATKQDVWGGSLRGTALFVAVCGLAILMVGVSPYVTNTVRYGHPFYPVFGADMSAIPDAPDQRQRPIPYREKPAPLAFAMSLTERTSAATTETMANPYRLKNPLSVTKTELISLIFPDARRGGFGPLFLLALMLAGVLFGLDLARPRGEGGGLSSTSMRYAAGIVVLLTLLMVEAWWARLAPMFFLAPLLVALVPLSQPRGLRTISGGIAVALVAVLCANALLIAGMQAFNYRNGRAVTARALASLQGATTVMMRFPDPVQGERYGVALRQRLRDAGFESAIVPYDPADPREWRDEPGLLSEVLAQ